MPIPIVAIVGRPNVGKSSLFNSICRERIAIVEPTAGVTRDRITAVQAIEDHYFELVDTGGYGIVDRDDLEDHVERQIHYAVEQAHLILFVVDARDGITALDRDTAKLLRRHTDSVLLLANKVDEPHMISQVGEFTKLGFGEALPVSASNGSGRRELLQVIGKRIEGFETVRPPEPVMKLALVGRRNAGKSSFLNALAGEERVIVSEKPGTTRDSIDVRIEKDGRVVIAIDTAGVRKRNKLEDDIEFYAFSRASRSIHRADVVALLIDASVPVGQIDKRLGCLIAAERKPCILVINKWDLARNRASTEQFGEYLTRVLPELDYAPISFTTARDGRNIPSTVDLATELFKQANTRVGTGKVNAAIKEALSANTPSPKRGHRPPKFYFATQVATRPPTIVMFVNSPQLVSENYRRFLLNRLREALPFGEIPIELIFRAHRRQSTWR